MSNLFSRLKAGSFGSFGNKFDNVPDNALFARYQSGDPDALAEFANRHPDLLKGTARTASKRLGSTEDENLGDLWLAMHKAANSYDPSAGASAKTWASNQMNFNTKSNIRDKVDLSEKETSIDNAAQGMASRSTKGAEAGDAADALMSKQASENFNRESDVAELRDMIYKLQKELEKIQYGAKGDKTGRDVMDAYKLADWRSADKELNTSEKLLALGDKGGHSSAGRAREHVAPIAESDVADELGDTRQTFRHKKQSMLDKLPTKLKEEILARLRGEGR